jgi:hypothetical protein
MALVQVRLILGAIALAVISGCARPNYAERWPDRLLLSAGPQPGYAIKRLVEKQSPATLVADDGSVCRTSPRRFASSKEGQWIACIWNLPALDSTQTIGPDAESDDRQIAALN